MVDTPELSLTLSMPRRAADDADVPFPVTVHSSLRTGRRRTSMVGGSAGRLRVAAVLVDSPTLVPRLQDVLHRLEQGTAASLLRVDIVCGHDRALREQITQWAAQMDQLRVYVHGHVPELQALFGTADLSLLPAVGGLLASSVAAGTPVMTYDWQPHQERVVRLLARLGCGGGCRDSETLTRVLEDLVADPGRLSRWAAAALVAAAEGTVHGFTQRGQHHIALPDGLPSPGGHGGPDSVS